MSTGVPMGGGVITGRDGLGNPIVTYYGSGPAQPAGGWFNVWDYWQDTDQWPTLDHALMFNRAIAAAVAAGTGAIVYAPRSTYITNSSIIISAGNIILRGDGDATLITAAPGSSHDIISTPIPGTVGASGYAPQRIGIEQLKIDCIGQTANVTGQGNGIHWYGVRYSFIRDVQIWNCQNWSILLDGDNSSPGFNFSYNNYLNNVICDKCNAGIWANFSEANWFDACHLKYLRTSTTAPQPANGNQDTTVYCLRLGTGYQTIQNCVFGTGGGTATTAALYSNNNGPQKIIGCRFDTNQAQCLDIESDNALIIGNSFENPSQHASGAYPVIKLGASHCIIANNRFDNTAGGTPKYSYCIQEPFDNVGNVITGNSFTPGVNGVLSMGANSLYHAHGNDGLNPLAPLPAPVTPTGNTPTTGGTVPAGTYQVAVTLVNAFGETVASSQWAATTTGATSTIGIAPPARVGNATGWYAYVSQAGGGALYRQQSSPGTFGNWYTVTTTPTTSGPAAPGANTTAGFVQPAVPASTVYYVNRFGVDCTVYIAGGTVTAVTIGGVASGLTSGMFRVPTGQAIAITYSAAPTWVWIGE